MQRLRPIGRVEGEPLEDVQRLADGRAPARRRAHTVDVEPAIAHSHRRPLGRNVARTSRMVITPGRQTWLASAAIGGFWTASTIACGDRAAIETLGAEVRDPLVRSGEVGVAKHGADVARSAVRVEVDRLRRGDVVEEVDVRKRLVEERLVDDEALASQLDRRPKRLGQRHRPVAAQRLVPRAHGPGHAGREPAEARIVERERRSALPERVGPHRGGAVSRPSIVVTFPSAVRMTMNPPPPIPHENGSVTPSTAAATTAASTAFAPSRSASTAASVASTSTVAAAPPLPTAVGALTSGAGCACRRRHGQSRSDHRQRKKRAKQGTVHDDLPLGNPGPVLPISITTGTRPDER